ncbi:MAG: methyl-accepting chemotaxis protein [Hahellaceae bacterium]|nr:methyl-accepting chemotaxis protein [Hahellaceae bacterium]MCP5170393.1 methyl-accepting chemotaxis protein [Hahellaceae bacterium]
MHELQKERGNTAGFIGSKGSAFKDKLASQRQLTDTALKNYQTYLKVESAEITHPEVLSLLSGINQQLQKLGTVRSNISSLNISAADAIGFYTDLNRQLLAVATSVATISEDAAITREILAYHFLLKAKEQSGIERAVLSNTFAQNKFGTGFYEKFIAITVKQEEFLGSYKELAHEDHIDAFNTASASDAFEKVDNFRNIAKEKAYTGNFNIVATEWFDAATQRINILKDLEDAAAKKLLENTSADFEHAWNTLLAYSLVTTLIIAVSLAIITATIANTSIQVKCLLKTMQAVEKDNNLGARTRITGEDELAMIANHLDRMLESFSQDIDDISKSSIQLASAAEETTATVASTNVALADQQSQTTMLATATNELAASAQEVANNTQMAADSANDASHQAQQGKSVVSTAVHSIQALAKEIDEIGQIIGRLHQNSTSIYGVLDVIKSVAEQTNLLALNAAIEAARAGEQGRGFAVVADEVRSLAQRTQKSTQEIETMLSGFQRDSSQAAKVVSDNKQNVETTVTNAGSISVMLDGILSSVNTIRDMNLQIASATEEQVAVTHEISDNVHRIADMATHTASAADQISVAAHEQAQLAERLQNLAKRYHLG